MSHTRVGPPDASVRARYAGIAPLARRPRLRDVALADTVVLGVPFDSVVSDRADAGTAHHRGRVGVRPRSADRNRCFPHRLRKHLGNDPKDRVGRLLATRTLKDKDV